MDYKFDSTDRRPGDYVLFALAFVGFVMGVAGIILSSPGLAIVGALLLVWSVYSFWPRSAHDES